MIEVFLSRSFRSANNFCTYTLPTDNIILTCSSNQLELRQTMQYLGCCPNPDGTDTIETTLTTQQYSTRSPQNVSPTNLNGTGCNAPVNPYRVLELRRDATPAEIIRSYRKLALMYHPGRKVSCPLERKKRVQFFEILAACYETLMHNEFRRKCDVLLRESEKKHNNQMTSQQPKQLQSTPFFFNTGNTHLPLKGADAMPALTDSSSSSASGEGRIGQSVAGSDRSKRTLVKSNCTALGGMFICTGGPSALPASDSSVDKPFLISRDGTKGFKSLADSSTLSASQSQEEGEVHFSEETVNRLFGGPMACLHRARNFQAFSDPYLVFDKVFGTTKPLFPRVTLADVQGTPDEFMEEALTNRYQTDFDNSLVRTASYTSQPELQPLVLKGKNPKDDQSENTKVFISSRIVNGKKVTKTETVHLDPITGVASVNVTVDSEYLEPVKSKTDSSFCGYSVLGWLLCFGSAKVKPTTVDLPRTQSSRSLPRNPSGEEKLVNTKTQSSLQTLYSEVLERFYHCNEQFQEECNKYMRCGRF